MQDLQIISFFLIFYHEVRHHKVRKVMDLGFWKKVLVGSVGSKSPPAWGFQGFGKNLIHSNLNVLFQCVSVNSLLTDYNGTRTPNHLGHKRILNNLAKLVNLAKWLSVRLRLSGCGFESRCSHLNFRFRACFQQGVPWHSGIYIVSIHSEMCTWHDKNIQ